MNSVPYHIGPAWAKNEIESILTRNSKTEYLLIVRSEWKAESLSERSCFPWYISIILFVHFLLENTFFPIIWRFTDISFQALDFLYFTPCWDFILSSVTHNKGKCNDDLKLFKLVVEFRSQITVEYEDDNEAIDKYFLCKTNSFTTV